MASAGRLEAMPEHRSEQHGQLQWRITSATLAVAAGRLDAVERLYCDELGISGSRDATKLRLDIGSADLTFVAATESEPFYHFAFLVPGNRFEAAREWLAAGTPLLARAETGETTFDFDFWEASACYAHDPAGNIVELIAHLGLEDSTETGDFSAAELRGISEVGLVTDDLLATLERLRAGGLELWYGEVGRYEGLGFVGRKAHTLILVPTGRPWLPTGRPAESHPVEVALAVPGRPDLVARLRGGSLEVSASKDG
jgi:catechol 2,3-dioxygenase-like lactoylglutathione lyase family enzyme